MNKYSNTYQGTIKMKPADVTSSTQIYSGIEDNEDNE